MLTDLFPDLEENEIAIVSSHLDRSDGKRGTVLMELGNEGRDMFLVESGVCEVYQMFSMAGQVFALRVAHLEGPLMLGEANLLMGSKRNAAVVVSSEECVFYKLSYDSFEKIKKKHPEIAIKMLEQISIEVTRRFFSLQENLQRKMLSELPTPQAGITYLRKYVGDVHVCSRVLAKKLFNIEQPDFDLEDSTAP